MSLAEKLNEIREGAKERIPDDLRAIMKQATEGLEQSGIADGALKEGETIPPFELANLKGDLVSSEDLLQRGSLVMTFYRGVW